MASTDRPPGTAGGAGGGRTLVLGLGCGNIERRGTIVEGISLITPTGGRREAFALCERWMKAQTAEWNQWIVVDDCKPHTVCTMGQQIIRPRPAWSPGNNTQHRNMAVALDAVSHEFVFVIEDDDYYSPEYLARLIEPLRSADIVGETCAKYYNVAQRTYRRHKNCNHASLSQTAFRLSTVGPLLRRILPRRPKWIDMDLWADAKSNGLRRVLQRTDFAVGIKGLPGRPGLGMGHRPSGYRADRRAQVLRHWLGRAAAVYAQFYRPPTSESKEGWASKDSDARGLAVDRAK